MFRVFLREPGETMKWTDRIKYVKIILVITAVVIAVTSLIISHFLIRDLFREEQNKMAVWAEAMRSLNSADETTDLNLVLKVLNGNHTIPVIVLDASGHVSTYRNIAIEEADTVAFLDKLADEMRSAGYVLRMSLSGASDSESGRGDDFIEICYQESSMLKRLATYPYIQLGVVLIFVIVAIFALLSSKKAEQNKVWVGLSKETAHQLGTPISSLMAWMEILRENYPDDPLLEELGKDVDRLQLIAERFSKIGSNPELCPENLQAVLSRVVEYISRRSSNKVKMVCRFASEPLTVPLNAALFEWVVENLCKNAIDAMAGAGRITLSAFMENGHVVIEVADTGKGITKKHFKTVFTPGFTTKKRGWGLGLSLAKRIVEEYHKGRIFVKNSEPGKGTVFRIELKNKVFL